MRLRYVPVSIDLRFRWDLKRSLHSLSNGSVLALNKSFRAECGILLEHLPVTVCLTRYLMCRYFAPGKDTRTDLSFSLSSRIFVGWRSRRFTIVVVSNTVAGSSSALAFTTSRSPCLVRGRP